MNISPINFSYNISPSYFRSGVNKNGCKFDKNIQTRACTINPTKEYILYPSQAVKVLEKDLFPKGYPFVDNFTTTEVSENQAFLYDEDVVTDDYSNKQKISLSELKKNDTTSLECKIKSKDKKTTVRFKTTNNYGSKCGCECIVKNNDGKEKMLMTWSYPDIEFSYYGDEKNMELMKDSLIEMKEIISSDKYKNDYGNTQEFKEQLELAIDYLSTSASC